MAEITVRVPHKFYDDHVDRDLPGGKIVKVLSRQYDIELDDAEYAELLSDAEYYSDAARLMGSDFIGLGASAQATVRALLAVQR